MGQLTERLGQFLQVFHADSVVRLCSEDRIPAELSPQEFFISVSCSRPLKRIESSLTQLKLANRARNLLV